MSSNGHGDGSSPVVFRRVHYERAGAHNQLTVYCPRRNQVTDAAECRECGHCRGLCIDGGGGEVFVRCAWLHGQATPRPSAATPAALSSIMSTPVHCVSPDASLESVRALFVTHAIGAAPVVDHNGRTIGVVSKGDILRALDQEGAVPGVELMRARQVMSHVVFALHSEADISRAAALMAYEGVHHIVVTDAEGKPAGIVSALDIMRWFARDYGYVIPGA